MKDTLYTLRALFVMALYALSVTNLICSIANRDVYDLAMAILLHTIANEHKRELDKIEVESEEDWEETNEIHNIK